MRGAVYYTARGGYDSSPLYKREGNWAELAFSMTSGIVTGDGPVSYWPIGNWAELAFAMTSGMVTGDLPVSYWPIGNWAKS